ncbi:hypothetical protein SCUCBS95973_000350 [Sporothrix curviconia]|uniref:Zn(2)-C6 fungal-type domain-containing protein n=1 Tax=Sporothrix curviconia TaxID=1260050 RepID=A0ABP0APE9_9PEZI
MEGPAPSSEAEKHAASTAAAPSAAASSAATAPPKQRSCVTCRQRKVRCDKLSPCTNCRRADIPCVLPSTERPPRWARRLKQQQEQQQQQQHQQQQQQLLQSGFSAESSSQSPRPNAALLSSALSTGSPLVDPDLGNPADVAAVLDRLKQLEALVRDLSSVSGSSSQLPPGPGPAPSARAAKAAKAAPATAAAPAGRGAAFGTAQIQERFGRLILDDDASNRRRYVGSGFWSRINDELDVLRAETGNLADGENGFYSTDDSDIDDADDGGTAHNTFSPAGAAAAMYITVGHPMRTAADRSAFLFGHNLQPALGEASQYRPLPSQIPFLFQVFIVNVNMLTQIVHVPTINKIVNGLLGDTTADAGRQTTDADQQSGYLQLTPATEALMFAIYYAAVVVKNFGTTSNELSLKYRIGFELSMAKANFLESFDLEILQALVIFLLLCRRYDSPRYVWMMTGIAIRMAKGLGLHRDGSSFGGSLTAYEVEIRRRVWWTVCAIDVRSAEDQGTDLTIMPSDFDTRFPLNINDNDISPDSDTTEPPAARDELTDITYARLNFEVTGLAQRMMASAAAASKETGQREQELLEEQNAMLDEVYQKLDHVYLRHSPDTTSVIYWTGITITRLFLAKMTLILNLPRLIHEKKDSQGASPSENEDLRMRLLSSAIEVAEYTDALKTERACRRWRWMCETYTQWHTIAFLLMETGRRPWDPAVERAWVALHGPYLIPAPPASLRKKDQQQQQQQSGQWQDSNQPTTSRAASISAASAGGASNSNTNKSSKSNKSNSSADSSTQFFWLPLRRLMARARRHRASELARLRANTKAARALEIAYDIAVADGRSRPLCNPGAVDAFRDRWRRLVGLDGATSVPRPQQSNNAKSPVTAAGAGTDLSSANSLSASSPPSDVSPSAGNTSSTSSLNFRRFGDLSEVEYTSVNFPAPNPNSVDAFILSAASQTPQQLQQQQQQQQNERGTFAALSPTKNKMTSGPWANFDPWQVWGNTGQANSMFDADAGAASDLIKDTPLLFGEDFDMDMDAEPNIDWDNWFATSRGF